MEKHPCKNCRRLFTVTPQRPTQKYCSCKKCQRARKSAWQKQKMDTDEAYRLNQKKVQDRWREKNPGYSQNYRATHPDYTRKNREAQAERNRKSRHKINPTSIYEAIAKMDVSKGEYSIKPGRYTIFSAEHPNIAKMDVIIIGMPLKSDSCDNDSAKKG